MNASSIIIAINWEIELGDDFHFEFRQKIIIAILIFNISKSTVSGVLLKIDSNCTLKYN